VDRVSVNVKRSKLKSALAKRIRSGEYPFGSRFPGLNDLIREYDASYVTVNKAVKLLADEGYLRCRPGIGYFVCYTRPDAAACRKVNLLTSPSYYGKHRPVFRYAQKLFEDHGWEVKLLLGADLYEFTEQLNAPDAYSIITAFNVNWERFSATFGHMVHRTLVLGRLSGNPEITSIICDEYESIRQCMDHFASLGKKKIALVSSDPQSELESLRIAAWRSLTHAAGLSGQWTMDHLFSLDLKHQSDSEKRLSALFREWLHGPLKDAEGIILPGFPAFFLAACRKEKISVPEDLAVTVIGCEDRCPRNVSFLDNNLRGHFQYALERLEDRFRSNRIEPGSWHFCEPLGVRPGFPGGHCLPPKKETGETGGTGNTGNTGNTKKSSTIKTHHQEKKNE